MADEVLKKYLPSHAVAPIMALIETHAVYLKIVNQRQSKHGDYRKLTNGQHAITINNSLNKYRFLMTLVHELAHLIAFEKYGREIKPHGIEWKYTFQNLMKPLLTPAIFPSKLLPLLSNHFSNPTASSDRDAALSVALQQYDAEADTYTFVYQLPYGSKFRTPKGRIFKKGPKKIKRYQCQEVNSGKLYLFQPNAKVELVS